jgi:hypothetical protein
LFALTDFNVAVVDANFGVGYGFAPQSDRWVAKTIIGYAFPVPGAKSGDNDRAPKGPIDPMSHAIQRTW